MAGGRENGEKYSIAALLLGCNMAFAELLWPFFSCTCR